MVNEIHELSGITEIAINLPKYKTTREQCNCPAYTYRPQDRPCKHIKIATLLLDGLIPCLLCGRTGPTLDQHLRCFNDTDCQQLMPKQEICLSCGLVIDFNYESIYFEGLFAHKGKCAIDSGLQDNFDRASLAALFG